MWKNDDDKDKNRIDKDDAYEVYIDNEFTWIKIYVIVRDGKKRKEMVVMGM